MSITDRLGKELLFCDGAMGTMIQQRGLEPGEIPEVWNITRADDIRAIHGEFLAAGADIIGTNTFGANAFKLEGCPHTVEEVVRAAIRNAKSAVDSFGAGRERYVALSVGPLGKLLKPLGEVSFEDAYNQFREIVAAGACEEPDLIIIETMNDTYELKAAILAAKENSDLPVFASVILDEEGKLLTGADVQTVVAMAEGLGADAIGFNCGLGPAEMKNFLPDLREAASLPITFVPNAGIPKILNGETVYEVEPEDFALYMKEVAADGVCALGGCCGTRPEHIKAMIEACAGMKAKVSGKKQHTVICSYDHAVRFGEKPIVVGERINPTGKSRLKEALRGGDREYILREALAQKDEGADVLDINLGLPEIDEVEMLRETVAGVQTVSDLPLQIDTSDPKAMEEALRIYNGKAMINSVNGKRESMEAVFPLVKKYGGVCVCLALDDEGIPETPEGRVAIIKKIVETATTYGIDKKDLIADTLTTTVSTGERDGCITLEALRYIRRQMQMHTVLGVSNVSFGLPLRDEINSTFFTLALENGLSAGIIDPGKDRMMKALRGYETLKGIDKRGLGYIEAYSDAKPARQNGERAGEVTLREAIVSGLSDSAAKVTAKLLETRESLDIIDNDLIPALDIVGKKFETGEVFLPQLLMSADATQAAFEKIKERMVSSPAPQVAGEKIVLATVKGDIHDIGKNIVKVLLENYGFDVIDLGRDVDPRAVLNAVIENEVKLAGLSALMTTTVVSMEETIKLLRKSAPECRVMVGGAVLNEEYAEMIDADKYSVDAMASVRYANDLFGKERRK